MTLSKALEADRNGQIERAADEYESALANDANDLVATVNLLVLYWQSTDYGFSLAHRLSQPFIANAGTRLAQLLNIARERFPECPEVLFWTRYIVWADRGDAFDVDECRVLLKRYPDYLEPAMALFSLSQGKEAADMAIELLNRCRADNTTRSRDVSSVIEGVLKRRKFTQV